MKIVADENIVALEEYFSGPWEITTLSGRGISAGDVTDADILLVRSVTQVNHSLLAESRVRLVGSATSGLDHVDQDFLAEAGIELVHAAGANANSVVEYVISALAALEEEHRFPWQQASVSIIGAGNIGGRLARLLKTLRIPVSICDPFLASDNDLVDGCVSLDQALRADIITLHVPLTRTGPSPTWQLLDSQQLEKLAKARVLINAARGPVINNKALLAFLQIHPGLLTVLDTWENEPAIDQALLDRVSLGTAHIAGYSDDGKRAGTAMLRHHCESMLGPMTGGPVEELETTLTIPAGLNTEAALNHAILQAYDIRQDHRRLREIAAASDPAAQFDRLRREYPGRREFHRFQISNTTDLQPETREKLRLLGFLC